MIDQAPIDCHALSFSAATAAVVVAWTTRDPLHHQNCCNASGTSILAATGWLNAFAPVLRCFMMGSRFSSVSCIRRMLGCPTNSASVSLLLKLSMGALEVSSLMGLSSNWHLILALFLS